MSLFGSKSGILFCPGKGARSVLNMLENEEGENKAIYCKPSREDLRLFLRFCTGSTIIMYRARFVSIVQLGFTGSNTKFFAVGILLDRWMTSVLAVGFP